MTRHQQRTLSDQQTCKLTSRVAALELRQATASADLEGAARAAESAYTTLSAQQKQHADSERATEQQAAALRARSGAVDAQAGATAELRIRAVLAHSFGASFATPWSFRDSTDVVDFLVWTRGATPPTDVLHAAKLTVRRALEARGLAHKNLKGLLQFAGNAGAAKEMVQLDGSGRLVHGVMELVEIKSSVSASSDATAALQLIDAFSAVNAVWMLLGDPLSWRVVGGRFSCQQPPTGLKGQGLVYRLVPDTAKSSVHRPVRQEVISGVNFRFFNVSLNG